MAMQKIYQRVNWENKPSVKTPINKINLNKMDKAIDDLDDRIVDLDTKSQSSVSKAHVIAYIIGGAEFSSSWLSESYGGPPLTPNEKALYIIDTFGVYYRCIFIWNGDKYIQVGDKYNRLVNDASETDDFNYLYTSYSWYSRVVYSKLIPTDRDFVGKFDINFSTISGCTVYYLISVSPPDHHEDYTFSSSKSKIGVTYGPVANNSGRIEFDVRQQDLGKYFSVYGICGTESGRRFELNGSGTFYKIGNSIFSHEYMPKTTLSPSWSGLIPGCSNDEASVFMSDGKWHTLDELKEMLGIGSQP